MIFCVPPLVAALGIHPLVLKTDFSNTSYLVTGAAPIGSDLMQRAYDRIRPLARSGFSIAQSWGLSESCSSATMAPPGRPDKFASIGVLLPGTSARFVDDDERDVKRGEPGEIWLRNAGVMRGYLGKPEVTAETITQDGWLKTGDVGTIDEEGFIYIVDRKKELIKYNAYQVAPAEVEGVLGVHPDVLDVGVVGVPAPDGTTELPRAYISLRNPEKANDPSLPQSVAEWLESRVSDAKRLRGGVIVVEFIPRSPSGKILRRDLRLLLKDHPVKYERQSRHAKSKL